VSNHLARITKTEWRQVQRTVARLSGLVAPVLTPEEIEEDGTEPDQDPAESPIDIDTTPPLPPQGLSYVVGADYLTASWQPNTEPDFREYVLEIAHDASFTDIAELVTTTATSHSHKLEAGVSHWLRICAVDQTGNRSPYVGTGQPAAAGQVVEFLEFVEAPTATAVPAMVQEAVGQSEDSKEVVASWPGATAAGNTLYAILSNVPDTGPSGFDDIPGGWSEVVQDNQEGHRVSIYRIAGASSRSGNERFRYKSRQHRAHLTLLEYSGITTQAPNDSIGNNHSYNGDPAFATGKTTLQAEELWLAVVANRQTAVTQTTPGGWTKETEQIGGGGVLRTCVYWKAVVALGTPEISVDLSGLDWYGAVIATFKAQVSADYAAPGPNRVRVWAKDNGAGKTQWVARFPTGAVQQVTIEP
jgi:hypothetical protein